MIALLIAEARAAVLEPAWVEYRNASASVFQRPWRWMALSPPTSSPSLDARPIMVGRLLFAACTLLLDPARSGGMPPIMKIFSSHLFAQAPERGVDFQLTGFQRLETLHLRQMGAGMVKVRSPGGYSCKRRWVHDL